MTGIPIEIAPKTHLVRRRQALSLPTSLSLINQQYLPLALDHLFFPRVLCFSMAHPSAQTPALPSPTHVARLGSPAGKAATQSQGCPVAKFLVWFLGTDPLGNHQLFREATDVLEK